MKTDESQAALSKNYPVLRSYAAVSAVLSLAYGLINYFISHKANLYAVLIVNIGLSALFAWYLIRAKNKKLLVMVLRVLLVLDVLTVLTQILGREFYAMVPIALLAVATFLTLQKLGRPTQPEGHTSSEPTK